MNLLTAKIIVKGGNFDLFIKKLKSKNISVLSIRQIGLKYIEVTVKYKDRQKVFAICKNMWYNVGVGSVGGLLSPIFPMLKRAGFVIGIALFFSSHFYQTG